MEDLSSLTFPAVLRGTHLLLRAGLLPTSSTTETSRTGCLTYLTGGTPRVVSQSVSQSVITTLLPTEHMVHTHTLVFFSSGVESRHIFIFWQAIALQDDLLVTLRFHLSFLLAQILMRTDLGDEPDRPRR